MKDGAESGILKPFVKSNEILNDPAKLRRRAERDGYLFFRGLLKEEAVLRVRQDFARILERHGWLDDGTRAIDVVSSGEGFIEGSKASLPVFCEFQRLESFHCFAHSAEILSLSDRLFGEPTFVHPQKIGRISFPAKSNYTTPAHQDFVHIQGTEACWTAWIPLGDCPRNLGGLAVFPGSQALGLLTLRRALGPGSSAVDVSKLDGEWRSSDFRAGDVLFFNSLAIHKALPNTTDNRVRLSVDYRYQGISRPITEKQLLPHSDRFPWSVVYEGWKSKACQYYWKGLSLNIVSGDAALYRFEDDVVDKGKKVKRTFNLPAELSERLTRHCQDRNQYPSRLVRDLLGDYLEKNRD